MTTIAYKDGIVAVDSYYTAGELITDYDANKITRHKGLVFLFCGTVTDYDHLVSAYLGDASQRECDAAAYVIDGGKLYHCAFDGECNFWKFEIKREAAAIGSGASFAYGAMDAGKTAVEAVKIACNRDIYSGGKVRTVKVK